VSATGTPVPAQPNEAVFDDEAGFIVELERFHGPLDLLLHLIRSQDIDIFDIPIARITSQFLGAIKGIERGGLDRAGEFLETASLLIRIKAQMLMPRGGGQLDAELDPRAELVRRLLEYEHFRDVARHLDRAQAQRRRHYRRGYVPPRPQPGNGRQRAELKIAWSQVWNAALALTDRNAAPSEHRVMPRAVAVEDKVVVILRALAERAEIEFRRLIEPFRDKLHGVVTLLAGLELSKRQQIRLRQGEPFGPLWICRRDD
jgi:segregation and condensation protein A